MNRRHLLAGAAGLGAAIAARAMDGGARLAPDWRLPASATPEIECWFWTEREFEPEGWRPYLEQAHERTCFRLLTTSIRAPLVEVTDEPVIRQIGEAAAYARTLGMGVVMDLDVRLARRAFERAHPDELQEMLRIRAVEVADGVAGLEIAPAALDDHYTGRTTPYISLAGRLERAWAFRLEGGLATDVREVTDLVTRTRESAEGVAAHIPAEQLGGRTHVAFAVAFTHLTPDAFGPHLLAFQRAVLEPYRSLGLAGACKDEWGFPPCFDGNPTHDDFWYSRAMAEAYRRLCGGDLARDLLLAHLPEAGRERERSQVVRRYQRMGWERNVEIECDYCDAVKEILGPSAVVATHPTWWPAPDVREMKKNGLSWWGARRDFAQTDEVTPYCCRTALAKKWASPSWWNMYYAPAVGSYLREVWAAVLAGGRLNIHPVWPTDKPIAMDDLYDSGLIEAMCRTRLLGLITEAPLDCRVAVVFGHMQAMDWTSGSYGDVGLALAEALWLEGFPCDLIPSTEAEVGALRRERGGRLRYGAQSYELALLWEASECDASGDHIVRLGRDDWREALPRIVARLEAAGIERQFRAVEVTDWGLRVVEPPVVGRCRLLDGTRVAIAASSPLGDPIELDEESAGVRVRAQARGLLALRWDARGRLEALAASGLTRFEGGGVAIALEPAADLALVREAAGWRGWLQGWRGPLPSSLEALTQRWRRLELPPSLTPG